MELFDEKDNMEIIENHNGEINKLDEIIDKFNNKDEIKQIYNKDFKPIKTTKYLTLFEFAAIIGKRASQIQDNAPILINDYNLDDSTIQIATKELKKKVIPYIIRRPLPNDTYEDVKLNNLIIKQEY